MVRIPDKVRQLIFERDGGKCPHCGEMEAIGLQHRISKGMGGSRLLDVPSNLLTFCNIGNAAMESNPDFAQLARGHGWKLSRWDDPKQVPIYDSLTGHSYLLTDTYARRRAIWSD